MLDVFESLRIQAADTSRHPSENWRSIASQAVAANLKHDQCRQLWETVFSDWDLNQGPKPIWCPALSDIESSNISKFCNANGFIDFDALHRWSVESPAEFWQATLQQLQIQFAQSPRRMLDVSQGIAHAKWLPDARMNIVNSCLPELLETESNHEPSAAIVWTDKNHQLHRWTRAELIENVQKVSAAFRSAGLENKRIAMLTPMTPWSVAVYLGIIHCGGCVVSIADSFSAPEIRRRLDIAECQHVVTCDYMLRAGRRIELLDRVHQSNDLGTNDSAGPISARSISAIVLSASDDHQLATEPDGLREHDISLCRLFDLAEEQLRKPATICDVENPINILFSSGTTGDPKAIPWNHSTPIKCAADGWFHQDIRSNDVVAWPTNLGWMMGPWLIFATLINKAAIALYHDAPSGPGFGKFVQDSRVTMLGLVPSIVKAWRAAGDIEGFDWSSIRCFSSTGESSNADDYFYLSWLAGFKPIIEYCGGTEIGGGYITSTVTSCNAAATFSTPAIGLDFQILDAKGNPAEEGELFLIPPSIGLSSTLLNRDHFETYYADVPKSGDFVLRRHGDHFRALPGGYFEAGGRADDTMNLGGIKVSSIEIEKVINSISGVHESAAVAQSEGKNGPSRLVMFLVLNDETAQQSIDQWLLVCNRQIKDQLNPLFKVSEVRTIEKLPRTASNKIMRRLLRDTLS